MFAFNWPIIIFTTIILYVLTILTLPFNAIYATILLFSLISFWSRLPGVCIYEPVSIIYLMDFVDIFSIIIAIYIGPVQGAVFSLIWNLYPRLCGAYKTWPALLKDAGIQAVVTLLSPLFFAITGSIVTVVVIYSVIRLILYWIVNIFLPTRGFVEQTVRLLISGIGLLVINVFYAKLFGDFFSGLLEKGARFSWILFFVSTMIILVFAIAVFGFSPRKTTKKIGKHIIKMVRKRNKPKTEEETDNFKDTPRFEKA